MHFAVVGWMNCAILCTINNYLFVVIFIYIVWISAVFLPNMRLNRCRLIVSVLLMKSWNANVHTAGISKRPKWKTTLVVGLCCFFWVENWYNRFHSIVFKINKYCTVNHKWFDLQYRPAIVIFCFSFKRLGLCLPIVSDFCGHLHANTFTHTHHTNTSNIVDHNIHAYSPCALPSIPRSLSPNQTVKKKTISRCLLYWFRF